MWIKIKKAAMKLNPQNILLLFRTSCLIIMSLCSLSCLAQVQVDESQLIGNWCYKSTQTVAVKSGIVGVILPYKWDCCMPS